jgi:hypothetical protein
MANTSFMARRNRGRTELPQKKFIGVGSFRSLKTAYHRLPRVRRVEGRFKRAGGKDEIGLQNKWCGEAIDKEIFVN